MTNRRLCSVIVFCLASILFISYAFGASPTSQDWQDSSIPAHNSPITLTNGTISISSYNVAYLYNLQYGGTDFMIYPTNGGESYAFRYTSSAGEALAGWFQGTLNYVQDWTQTDPYSMYEIDETMDGLVQIQTEVRLPESGKYFYIVYTVTNLSSSETLTDVAFYEYVEPNADHSDTETTAYDSVRSMVYSYNPDQPYMGVAICSPADAYDISDFWTYPDGVLAHIESDTLNNNPGPYTGDSGFALQWDVGTLAPGEQFIKTIIFAVDDDLSALQQTMDGAMALVDPIECQLPLVPVYVDIKPSSCPNPLNLKSKGVLPVAVLSTEEFDVTTIDPMTILLSREEVEEGVAPIRSDYEDVATPFEGELCDCHDLNGDGYADLTLKFKTQELVETLGLGEVAGDEIPLTLTGNLRESEGGTAIKGADCILVLDVPKGGK